MAERFAGKVVLIAGGTGGLGRAVSLAFLGELAQVIVTYQREDEFVALKNASGAHGSSLEGHKADVTDEAAVRQLAAKLLANRGRLDVLVNAVGGYAGGTPLWELDSKVFEQMLALNLRSMFVLSRVVVPVMLKQGNGAILNVGVKGGVRSCGWSRRLCCIEGRGRGHDGFARGGPSRDERAGKFHNSQHYRYRSESQSNAGRGLCKVAKSRGDCTSHSIFVLRRRETRSWRGRAGIWKYVKDWRANAGQPCLRIPGRGKRFLN